MRTAIFLGCFVIAFQIKPLVQEDFEMCIFITIAFVVVDVIEFIFKYNRQINGRKN